MIDVADLPVMPKQHRVYTHRGNDYLAVMMPYPMSDPSEAACFGDQRFIEGCPGSRNGNTDALDAMRAVCHACPFTQACAEWGIAHEGDLMFGGLTPPERVAIRKARGQVLVEPSAPQEYGFAPAYVDLRHYTGGDADAAGATD